ncbi:ciliary microtubule associated protein 1A [Halyomorpha halys]|uniref:ciliary microtubule associated protein 1A n=1 Tax=Halyomorpha halys TaxID=286706 RepID=UPI0006D4FDC7|nr:outer dense fiber protein 3-B-like [Halyomorpha halys]
MAAKKGYKHNSPGPKYMLSTTIGPKCTDPTIRSPPGCLIGIPASKSYKTSSPGPNKYDTSGYNRKGKLFSPAFYFGTKHSEGSWGNITPSPQSYGTHLCPDTRHVRPPAWELGNPYHSWYKKSSPAPKYMLPQVTGGLPPDLPNVPAYTILGRDALKFSKSSSPGPGKYGLTEPEVYLTRAPSPAILSKRRESTIRSQTTPGPKYSGAYNWKVEPPSYTFGMKHSLYEEITYMPEDKQPFYGI